MNDHIAEVRHHPAVAGQPLFSSPLAVPGADVVEHRVCKRVDHAVTGSRANDEVIGEGYDVLDVDQDDILPFFVLQGIDDFAGKFKRVQMSPHAASGFENNFV